MEWIQLGTWGPGALLHRTKPVLSSFQILVRLLSANGVGCVALHTKEVRECGGGALPVYDWAYRNAVLCARDVVWILCGILCELDWCI